MTTSHHAPPLAFGDLAEALSALRERGLRISTPRRLVLGALFDADGPVSAELVARRLDLDPVSVYRNFEALERHGLVQHVHLGHGPGLYALRGAGEREYLYCERCGAVRAIEPAELDGIREDIRSRFGYAARFTHFPIVGTCGACAMGSDIPPQRHGDTMSDDEHTHGHPHSHPHVHDDGTVHEHPHSGHDHAHVEHDHEHSHGDQVHSHSHVHEAGFEELHTHSHEQTGSNKA